MFVGSGLGEQRMAELRGQEIDKQLARLERDLDESDAEALLGEERLEELRQQRIAVILEDKQEEFSAILEAKLASMISRLFARTRSRRNCNPRRRPWKR
jgi:hypothetical protein